MKFVKKFKKKVPWLSGFQDIKKLLELTPTKKKFSRRNICLLCRGTKLLCGKSRCPILVKYYSFSAIKPLIRRKEIDGSSPPAIFVGRYGYPYVNVSPLVPPIIGDTSLLDTPELWKDLDVSEIIKFRFSLVRGNFKSHVRDATKSHRIINLVQELAMAKNSVESYMVLKKEPRGVIIDSDLQPMGPSAPLENIDINSLKTNHLIEKLYEDDDLKALEAVKILYKRGLLISSIIRAFSVGLFGVKNERRFVPTRWSITAVDSMLSNWLINEFIKRNPIISEYRVFETTFFGDKFVVILIPDAWSYEFIEAWYPGTTWNPSKEYIAIGGDWEYYQGRTTYASIGGCYYAARLAVTEYLAKQRIQARVLILREAYPDHLMPLGVWHVREGVRKALKEKALKFDTLQQVINYIRESLRLSLDTWLSVSRTLLDLTKQRKLTDFFS